MVTPTDSPEITAPGSAPGSESSAGSLHPFEVEQVTLSKRAYIELRAQAKYYQRLHTKAIERLQQLERRHSEEIDQHHARETELLAALDQAKAEVRGLRQRHFGTKSERAKTRKPPWPGGCAKSHRPRGQQPGAPGHGRTRLPELPSRGSRVQSDRKCPRCGESMEAIAGTRDSEVIEIEVAAYRRVIKRQRYRAGCQCGCLPAIATAPPPPQLIRRGKLGISLWAEVLLSKYRYAQPTHRLCRDWRDRGVPIAQGTITGGLRKIQPLFAPLLDALRQRLREANHWHADETDWRVFEECEGKQGQRWYLWVFRSPEVVCFQLDPTRSAQVPTAVLTAQAQGVLSVDRYAAYHKYVRDNNQVRRALCWAHQRRDFLAVAIKYPELWRWAAKWVAQIAILYRHHANRRASQPGSRHFARCDDKLRRHLERMRKRAAARCEDPSLHKAARRLHRLMLANWAGLTEFVEHPEIALDNNPAEQSLRPAVVGRKNYYGSGSQWSGVLAADMMSLLATLEIWGINPRTWLFDYLHACAHAGGRVPPDHEHYLPWRMAEARRARLSAPVPTVLRRARA